MYRVFAVVYPSSIKQLYIDLLTYSNIKVDKIKFLGVTLLTSIFISILTGILFKSYIISIVAFFVVHIGVYFWLIVYAEKKAKFVEEVLPDALQLMATNMRAGFTTDKALLLSARPEFGPLRDELNIVGKEITAGKPIEESLMGIMKRVRSDKLNRSMSLVISGIKSGGRLADLLQETANELKSQKLIDKKVRSSVNMYVIFIAIATMFGAPLLFGLSTFLVEVISTTLKNVQIPSSVASSYNIPIAIKSVSISPGFVFKYAILSILTTSIFGSFTIGLISKGREKDGIKLLPVLIIVSLVIFFFVRFTIRNLTGGLFDN